MAVASARGYSFFISSNLNCQRAEHLRLLQTTHLLLQGKSQFTVEIMASTTFKMIQITNQTAVRLIYVTTYIYIPKQGKVSERELRNY